MPSKHIFLTIIMIFLWSGMTSQTLIMTDDLKDAYADISSLKLSIGESKLTTIKLKDPKNAMVYYIENYIDFYTLFIQEDAEKYKALTKNKDFRLEKIKASDPESPYYLFCQAEILLQWATIKLKFNDKVNAARDVYEAYKLLEKNKAKFPNFLENNKSLSIIHALAESLPGWVRKFFGVKGSIDLGTKEIKQLANSALAEKSMFKEEIVAIYSYILFYSNNKKEEAYSLFSKYGLDHKTNPLVVFLKAGMAQKLGRNEEAITIIEQGPKGTGYLPFYYLDFMYGKFKLSRLDKDANKYIEKFLKNFKGRHYIKEAYQKLAWYDIVINKDIASYKSNMKLAATRGNALIDEDIQAKREAKSNQIPNTVMLKARLLYDGGYYTKCQSILVTNSKKFVEGIHDGEYYYRMGRVSESLKNYTDAIDYYKSTLTKSSPEKYYGCSAALQLGMISEELKNYSDAKYYFEQCLAIDSPEYNNSLHQKAKSALDRIKNKAK